MSNNRPRNTRSSNLSNQIVAEQVGRRTITEAIIRAWGGADKFASDFRKEFEGTKAGSPVRARLLTSVLSAVLDFGEETPQNYTLEEIEGEFRRLTEKQDHAVTEEEAE